MIFNMQSGGMIPDDILDAQTITPGTSNKVIAAGTYLRGAQTILGDADLLPGNIKEGVNIFGVEGTHKEIQTTLPLWYKYTGSSMMETAETDDGKTWELKLLTSGTLTIYYSRCPVIDAFLVGGGGGGGYANYMGAGGGGGGYTYTSLDVEVPFDVASQVIIGAGGTAGIPDSSNPIAPTDGGTTSIFGLSATGGKAAIINDTFGKQAPNGGDGGSGGGGGGAYPAVGEGGSLISSGEGGSGQGTTTRAFGEATGTLYAGGGGGGYEYYRYSGGNYNYSGGDGGSNGSNGSGGVQGSGSIRVGGDGGSGGGGNAYSFTSSTDYRAQTPGEVNTGGGGAGGCYSKSTTSGSGTNNAGSAGGSGIIILRGRYA